MAINFKRPAPTKATPMAPKPRTLDDLIESAPDGSKHRGSMRGSKRAICLTIDNALLERFDAYASGVGMKRGELVSFLMQRLLAKNPSQAELWGWQGND